MEILLNMEKKYIILLCMAIIFICSSCKVARKTLITKSKGIAILSICASNGSYDTSILKNYGHVFITIKNISDTRLPLLNINLEVNETISLSIWPVSNHSGIWYNLESYFYNSGLKYNDAIVLSSLIDEATYSEITSFLSQDKKWNLFYNCCGFSVEVFNLSIIEDSLKLESTKPIQLKKEILNYTNYESLKVYSFDLNHMGKMIDGGFERCVINE